MIIPNVVASLAMSSDRGAVFVGLSLWRDGAYVAFRANVKPARTNAIPAQPTTHNGAFNFEGSGVMTPAHIRTNGIPMPMNKRLNARTANVLCFLGGAWFAEGC